MVGIQADEMAKALEIFRAPAWLLSLGTVGALCIQTTLKFVAYIKGQKEPPAAAVEQSSTAEIEFRTKMLMITERQEGLIERVHAQSVVMTGVVDRLVNAQVETTRMLKQHDEWERELERNKE